MKYLKPTLLLASILIIMMGALEVDGSFMDTFHCRSDCRGKGKTADCARHADPNDKGFYIYYPFQNACETECAKWEKRDMKECEDYENGKKTPIEGGMSSTSKPASGSTVESASVTEKSGGDAALTAGKGSSTIVPTVER